MLSSSCGVLPHALLLTSGLEPSCSAGTPIRLPALSTRCSCLWLSKLARGLDGSVGVYPSSSCTSLHLLSQGHSQPSAPQLAVVPGQRPWCDQAPKTLCTLDALTLLPKENLAHTTHFCEEDKGACAGAPGPQ